MKVKQFKDGFRFLSNFYPAHVPLDGIRYDTVEHAFQAAKTFNPNERTKVRTAGTPGKAKRAGRKVTLRPDWDEVKINVMENLVRQKFRRHAELKQQLLDTGDAELEEGNTWRDTFWGVDLKTGQGRNELGKILMRVRAELREEGK